MIISSMQVLYIILFLIAENQTENLMDVSPHFVTAVKDSKFQIGFLGCINPKLNYFLL